MDIEIINRLREELRKREEEDRVETHREDEARRSRTKKLAYLRGTIMIFETEEVPQLPTEAADVLINSPAAVIEQPPIVEEEESKDGAIQDSLQLGEGGQPVVSRRKIATSLDILKIVSNADRFLHKSEIASALIEQGFADVKKGNSLSAKLHMLAKKGRVERAMYGKMTNLAFYGKKSYIEVDEQGNKSIQPHREPRGEAAKEIGNLPVEFYS